MHGFGWEGWNSNVPLDPIKPALRVWKRLLWLDFKDFRWQINGSIQRLRNRLQIHYIITIPLDMPRNKRTQSLNIS
jgi:hypothetical protein